MVFGSLILDKISKKLNQFNFLEAEKYDNVKVEFNHKLVKCNTNTGEMTFENTESHENRIHKADLIVGCDGAYSSVRQSLLKEKPIDFSQYYISSWYLGSINCQLKIIYLLVFIGFYWYSISISRFIHF